MQNHPEKKERSFKLVIEYDGTDFHGWQRQTGRRTIQGEIEKALTTMTGQPVGLTGSGRTDAGVHALGQVAGFRCDTRFTPDVFHRGLNSLLPEDIVILNCETVPEAFHARFDAVGKCYRYRILNRRLRSAMERRRAWHISRELDRKSMSVCIRHLLGTHDFKSFEGAGSPRAHTIRTVSAATLFRDSEGFDIFEIEADGFLRFMVRNIVGTLVCVGQGKITAAEFSEILASRNRDLAGPTAPPQGLFLVEVRYPPPEE